MTNTALRAKKEKVTRTITFKNEKHKNFYNEYLQKCRYQDAYTLLTEEVLTNER